MARTITQKERAAAEIAKRLESSEANWRDAAPLRRIAEAFHAQVEAERELAAAVADARAQGHPWAQIAMMLGVSKQTAQQRFGNQQ